MMKRVLVAAALLLAPARAFAWDAYGHMVVAASAWEQITDPAVRKKIRALLKLNPQYKGWVKGVPTSDRDGVAFVMAATWPDFIKSDPTYTADGKDNGNRPGHGPEASQNIGYEDKLMHKYWHFVDLPFSPDGTATRPPHRVNAKTQIQVLRDALKSPAVSDGVKSYDLVWLEHLVGDVHQPLHCTSRFDKDQKEGDNGGNFVSLSGIPNELHAFWDDLLGTANTDHAAAIADAKKLKAPAKKLSEISDHSIWIDESFQAARQTSYEKPIGIGPGPFTVNAAYRKAARTLARKRVALAGARLANLLTDALH